MSLSAMVTNCPALKVSHYIYITVPGKPGWLVTLPLASIFQSMFKPFLFLEDLLCPPVLSFSFQSQKKDTAKIVFI